MVQYCLLVQVHCDKIWVKLKKLQQIMRKLQESKNLRQFEHAAIQGVVKFLVNVTKILYF